MIDIKKFTYRLRLLANEHGGVKPYARICGVNEGSLRGYLAQRSEPKLRTLGKIATGGDVSIAWLTGEVNDRGGRSGKVSATIGHGDQDKLAQLKDAGKLPTAIDPNLRIFIGWLNEYFEKYPEHSLRFLEDMKHLYPSLDEYADRIGGPEKSITIDKVKKNSRVK